MYHVESEAAVAAKVFVKELEVNSQLRAMGLDRRRLLNVIRAAVIGYGDVTPFDPPSARGFEPWRYATRGARETFVPGGEGWEQDDTANFSIIRHDVRKLKIAAMNCDDATGKIDPLDPDHGPRNRSKKGILHARAIGSSSGWIPGLPRPYPLPEHETWYLCLYIIDDQVRAELSLPAAIENSYVVAWTKRIILVGPDDWAKIEFVDDDVDDTEQFEPEVRLRK